MQNMWGNKSFILIKQQSEIDNYSSRQGSFRRKQKGPQQLFCKRYIGSTDSMALMISNPHLLNNLKYIRKGKIDEDNLAAKIKTFCPNRIVEQE